MLERKASSDSRRKASLVPDAEASVKLKIRRLYSCMGRVYTTSYSYILVSIFTVERHCRKLQPLLLEKYDRRHPAVCAV